MARIVFVDLDDTLCDFRRAARARRGDRGSKAGFWLALEPLPGAVEAFAALQTAVGIEPYVASAPSVANPSSYAEKRLWVERHLGREAAARLILCGDKSLLRGDVLIDDRRQGQGQERFAGELITFGSEAFPDWATVLGYLEMAPR